MGTHSLLCCFGVRESWMSMWSLDADGGKGAEEAVRRAHELVLKPQREGGGRRRDSPRPSHSRQDSNAGAQNRNEGEPNLRCGGAAQKWSPKFRGQIYAPAMPSIRPPEQAP